MSMNCSNDGCEHHDSWPHTASSVRCTFIWHDSQWIECRWANENNVCMFSHQLPADNCLRFNFDQNESISMRTNTCLSSSFICTFSFSHFFVACHSIDPSVSSERAVQSSIKAAKIFNVMTNTSADRLMTKNHLFHERFICLAFNGTSVDITRLACHLHRAKKTNAK